MRAYCTDCVHTYLKFEHASLTSEIVHEVSLMTKSNGSVCCAGGFFEVSLASVADSLSLPHADQ